MRHLLSGIGIAAALAVAAPALAQAPMTPGRAPAGAAPTQIADAGEAPARMAHHPRKHRRPHARRPHARRAVRAAGPAMEASPYDSGANELNRQELQRLQAGPAPGPMPPPMIAPPPGQAQRLVPRGPRASGGGNIRPGPGGPVSMTPGAAEEGPRTSAGGYIPAPTGPMPMSAPPPIAAPTR
jgi:hypothetical protein